MARAWSAPSTSAISAPCWAWRGLAWRKWSHRPPLTDWAISHKSDIAQELLNQPIPVGIVTEFEVTRPPGEVFAYITDPSLLIGSGASSAGAWRKTAACGGLERSIGIDGGQEGPGIGDQPLRGE